jgi:hypothetical protein
LSIDFGSIDGLMELCDGLLEPIVL